MALLTETVTAYFDLGGDNFFTLNDPVRGLLDSATYLLGGEIATDITDGFRSVQIGRGRERAVDEILAGVATVIRNNHDRSMDPEYASGYATLTGVSGAYVSTPDSAVLDLVGDIEIVVRVAMDDWTPAATSSLLTKRNDTGNNNSYGLSVLSTGDLQFSWSVAGTIIVNVSGPISTFNPGTAHWLKVTFDADNGAGANVTRFYTADDANSVEPTVWRLESTATSGAATSIFSGTAPVEIGSRNAGTSDLLAGKVYRAIVRNGIAGTIVADFDIRDNLTGASSWVSGLTGETWTKQGGATITIGGQFFGNIKPGKRVTFATNGIITFDGLIDDFDYDYPVAGDSTVVFDVADCLATLASAEFDEWTTTDAQLPGARLTSICDRPEVQFPSARAFDVGTSVLQDDLVSWGSNVLNYAQLVAKADLGMLFASKDGTLTFYGRNRSVTGVGAPVFSDVAADGIVYSGIVIDYGTELLFNRVSVDATGFTKQTVVDDASAEEFGGGGGRKKYYSLSLSNLPLNSAEQALDLANYLLNLYKSPINRIASITIDLHAIDVDDQATVLNLDIGSVIRVVYTPNRVGDPIDKFCMVEGVTHQIVPLWHAVTLKLSNLADAFSGQPFILDDAEYGLLNGSGVLAF